MSSYASTQDVRKSNSFERDAALKGNGTQHIEDASRSKRPASHRTESEERTHVGANDYNDGYTEFPNRWAKIRYDDK
jgi:hypothetical protein